MFEGEENQQDAISGESSDAPQTSTQNEPEVNASEPVQSQPQSKPFHEDPRIQEFIQRQVAKQSADYESRLEAMQRQMEQSQKTREQAEKKAHPFVAKLAEIDPKYGEWASNQEQLAEKLAQFEEWQKNQQTESLRTQYESSIEKLHNENKVSPEQKERIKERLDYLAVTNPKLGLKDIPSMYKEALERETKYLESVRRATTASYVKDKSKDSSAPVSQSKGAPVSSNGKRMVHTDRESAIAAVVKSAMKGSKASSEI